MFRKYLFIILIIHVVISCSSGTKVKPHQEEMHEVNFIDLKKKANELYSFSTRNNYNKDYCILIDMSIHSGLYRGFLWNFGTDTIADKFLVSHGCCAHAWSGDYTKTKPEFSNVPDSHCSSLGKYLVAERGWSGWGIHVNYKLDGLEASNSNARKRVIVLHSWDAISDEEVFPRGTPEGWGCPSVSNNTMNRLDSKLKSNKRVIMWIYNS
jgi:hypothetical protein